MLSTCKVYHHAPVNATGGSESGNWFAQEFTSPDRTKGWATIISLAKEGSASYVLKPRGLDSRKQYKVTFDNTGQTKIINAATLMREGITVQPTDQVASELLLFEAK
jgi:Glycosyl hydrolase family 36 C-terminal domain